MSLALIIYTSPIGYTEWKADGNVFWGGFHGFCSYFSSLTTDEQSTFIDNEKFSNDGALNSSPIREWKNSNDEMDEDDWKYRVIR